ncbi:LytTR family DNA-binding domain-containing protein [Stakelama tenebrarum]|uniref:LytTR family transcriptional regulator n=1 Tax=Stakelama tenebrarum TaxID=2711215 RepID=A0A6G6Y9X2_9SPHN|nr:LytTR family DNA-binding domain-containing protein [Sphingosinithalassobacter tenebrarum]QIG81373.1 LytTR family transcriptional regulator [Sphingosinithalassobacter tenebrarum]
MTAREAGTSGGSRGTSGGWIAAVLFVALTAIHLVVNALSQRSDFDSEPAHHIWLWEASSALGWCLLAWPIWHAVALLRPPRAGWPAAVGAHLALSVAASAIHVAVMVALRKAVYAGWGETYVFADNLPASLIYEYRKDLLTYVQIAASFGLIRWIAESRIVPIAREQTAPAPVLEIADGAVTHRVPVAEIDWAASAGNYVEIGRGERTLLHRSTLTALADRLGEDFVRIHRGRLVRRAAVARIETDRSGDFTVTLAGGQTLRGSRRYRGGL